MKKKKDIFVLVGIFIFMVTIVFAAGPFQYGEKLTSQKLNDLFNSKADKSLFDNFTSMQSSTNDDKLDKLIFDNYTTLQDAINSSKLDKSIFDNYTSNMIDRLDAKLQYDDFSLFLNQYDSDLAGKLDKPIFDSYTSAQNIINGNKLDKPIFDNYTSGQNIINGNKLDKLIFDNYTSSHIIYNVPSNHTSDMFDYLLLQNEIIYITYSGVTSVPLHVETSQGLYEISIIGNRTDTITNDTPTANPFIEANNTTYSSAFSYNVYFANDSMTSGTAAFFLRSVVESGFFGPFNGRLQEFSGKISTFTNNKYIRFSLYRETSGATTRDNLYGISTWEDTTTVWTSLGTISFPFAQSGTIIIKRIL